MATALYDAGRQGFLDGNIDWDTNTIKALLVDADYTPNLATDDNLNDIPVGARVNTAQTLASKTVTAGVADSSDPVFSAVTNPTPIVAVVLYKDTGTESTSRLIAYIDNLEGLPLTPNGGNVTVSWSNDSNRIFRL